MHVCRIPPLSDGPEPEHPVYLCLNMDYSGILLFVVQPCTTSISSQLSCIHGATVAVMHACSAEQHAGNML